MSDDNYNDDDLVKRSGLGRLTELQAFDIRVLGVLLEKEQTTPEYYPMSLKAIVAGSNQKNNRDPVMALTELEVLNVLRFLSQEKLVEREAGARVDRWRHKLDPLLKYKPAPKALLTELLLRGPQTPGELRVRCERMHPFESLAQVEALLRELAVGEERIVIRLPRQTGQKEERWVLGFEGREVVFDAELPAPRISASSLLEERVAALEARVDQLEKELRTLQRREAADTEISGDT